jgi:hypothetical protein
MIYCCTFSVGEKATGIECTSGLGGGTKTDNGEKMSTGIHIVYLFYCHFTDIDFFLVRLSIANPLCMHA